MTKGLSICGVLVAMSLLSACAPGAVGGAVVGDALFDAPVAGAVVGTAVASGAKNGSKQCLYRYPDGTETRGDCPSNM